MVMQWDNIIGQPNAVSLCKAMLSSGKLPHALLFTGPAGIGKSMTAQLLAGGILCTDNHSKPCGQCQSCLLYDRSAHPDFTLIRPDGAAVKIDQIRAVQHFASLAPSVSPGRVCLIEDAELMTVQAANSLLKLLEEPPPGFVFILVAGTLKPLLPTILSRCRQIRFQPLPVEELELALVNKGFNPEAAMVAARLSGGRMGRALTLLEPQGLAARDMAVHLFDSLQNKDMTAVWDQATKLDSLETKELLTTLDFFLYLFRDVLMIAGGYSQQLIYNIDLGQQLAKWAPDWSEGRSLAAITAVKDTIRAIGGNANTRLAIEELLIKLRDMPEKGDLVC